MSGTLEITNAGHLGEAHGVAALERLGFRGTWISRADKYAALDFFATRDSREYRFDFKAPTDKNPRSWSAGERAVHRYVERGTILICSLPHTTGEVWAVRARDLCLPALGRIHDYYVWTPVHLTPIDEFDWDR